MTFTDDQPTHARMLKKATIGREMVSAVGSYQRDEKEKGGHTDLDAVEPEEETRKDHLTQTKLGAECREEADWGDSQQVDEEDGEEGVDETQVKDGDGERTDGEGGDDHVGSKPLSM